MSNSPLPNSVLVTIDATGVQIVRQLPEALRLATCTFQRDPDDETSEPAVLLAWQLPGVVGEGQVLITQQMALQIGEQLFNFAVNGRVGNDDS